MAIGFQSGAFQDSGFQGGGGVSGGVGGSAKRGHRVTRRKQHYVEIDGKFYEVRNQAEAVEILARLRALAEKRVHKQVRKAVAKAPDAPVVVPLRASVKIDDYSTIWAQHLQAQVDAANAQIAAQYAKVLAAELEASARLWQRRQQDELRRQQEEKDDEDALIALGF